jgi:hypothetical protein
MAEASRDTVQLISGLIAHMRQIVGDGACYAMLHYGAMEEGKRFGAGTGPADLPKVLGRFDELLLQRTEILKDEGGAVTLRIHSSALLDQNLRAMQGVVLGLVEGALTASRSGRYKGSMVAGEGELLLELKRDG